MALKIKKNHITHYSSSFTHNTIKRRNNREHFLRASLSLQLKSRVPLIIDFFTELKVTSESLSHANYFFIRGQTCFPSFN